MAGTYIDAYGLEHLSLLIKQAITTAVNNLELKMPKILFAPKADWDMDSTKIAEANTIYVYTDYTGYDGKSLAGFKVGDGTSYLIDMPFVDQVYNDHINNSTIHITQAEREFWNNKVRCYLDGSDEEEIIFTTN